MKVVTSFNFLDWPDESVLLIFQPLLLLLPLLLGQPLFLQLPGLGVTALLDLLLHLGDELLRLPALLVLQAERLVLEEKGGH